MTTTQLEQEQRQTIEQEIAPALQRARALVVNNQDQRTEAAGFIKGLKTLRDAIEEKFKPTANKKKAYEIYQDLIETEHAFYDPIDEAVKIATSAVKKFDTEEALRIQREAEEAEAKRLEAERKEREKLQAKAEKAAEQGKVEKAEVFREQAQTVTVAPVFTPPPQPVKKLVWKARVTNLFGLLLEIVSHKIPFNVVEVRISALNDFAKGYDGKTKYQGLEFYQEASGRV